MSQFLQFIFLLLYFCYIKATWATSTNENRGRKKKRCISNTLLLCLTKEFNKLNFPINAIENLMSFLIYDFSRLEL